MYSVLPEPDAAPEDEDFKSALVPLPTIETFFNVTPNPWIISPLDFNALNSDADGEYKIVPLFPSGTKVPELFAAPSKTPALNPAQVPE